MSDRGAPFAPPFCPNERCRFHTDTTPSWHWVRAGFFERQGTPHRIQRFRCAHCGRCFSTQTFRTDYWLKGSPLLSETFHALSHCCGFRQLARKHGCSPQTVMGLAERLGRHCQLFHERLRRQAERAEALCLDGFRTFEGSQYAPSEFQLVVGQDSHFLYGFTHSELRRSGTMTPRQRRRRAEVERTYGRPDPRSVEREVARVLGIVTEGRRRSVLNSDENPDYVRALARLPLAVEHHTISSRAARTSRNPLFAINLADLVTRHSCANHKRETIAFSKRVAGSLGRMWVLLVWRNYVKWFSERRRGGTPAMRAGACAQRFSVRQVLAERLFPGRIPLPEGWAEHYWGQVPTRRIAKTRLHALKYAV